MGDLKTIIDEMLLRKRAGGVFDANTCARSVVEQFTHEDPDQWVLTRDQLALDSIAATIERRLGRLVESNDDRQGWLALPEYERVPQLIKVAGGVADVNEVTLSQYRESESDLAARIKSYNYPRRSQEKLKHDKQTLSQMRKLDRRVSPFIAGEPEMKMRQAFQLYQASLETPRAKHYQAIASKGGKAKSLRTKNQ